MSDKILAIGDFRFREEVSDPFLVRMHHLDYYPMGNNMEVPSNQLSSKEVGEDFDLKSPWRMYYGEKIPGFPSHPHRGFETVTIVLQGYVDHSDSLGATGRYGAGDVQWMTAGKGIQHAEMFPLVHDDKENTLELFQVWLNLPGKDKFVEPSYKMLWREEIPVVVEQNETGASAKIHIIAGSYKGVQSLEPTPNSWASNHKNHVGIWTVYLEPNASFTLPSISSTLNRHLYFYRGGSITVDGTPIDVTSSLKLVGEEEIEVVNGKEESYLLLLEGEPISEPAINYGPFVMNTTEEIQQAYKDYKATEFGGWPWSRRDPVNPRDKGRFAKYSETHTDHPD